MRLIVLGVDANGGSCIVEQGDLDSKPINGIVGASIAKLFSTSASPPPPVPRGFGKFISDTLPPGHLSWYVIDHAPRGSHEENRAATDLHWRNVIDLLFIVEGDGDMLLADGAHPMTAGDCIVMAGTDHGFRPGAGGCRLMAFGIGTQPA